MRTKMLAIIAALGIVISGAQAASAATAPDGENWGSRGFSNYEQPKIGDEISKLSAAENCGVKTNYPHASNTNSYQIHTRVESYCDSPVSSNQVTGTTYRSRWYGWENLGSSSAGPNGKQYLRITVAVNCDSGSLHRYRTNSRGTVVILGTTYTAASYEENGSEIRCRAA